MRKTAQSRLIPIRLGISQRSWLRSASALRQRRGSLASFRCDLLGRGNRRLVARPLNARSEGFCSLPNWLIFGGIKRERAQISCPGRLSLVLMLT
jgi:hypothetical protein